MPHAPPAYSPSAPALPPPADISNTLWCYASLGRAPPAAICAGLVGQAWKTFSRKGRDPEPQAESNILWSCAKFLAVDPGARLPAKRLEEFQAFSAVGLVTYTSQVRVCPCPPTRPSLITPGCRRAPLLCAAAQQLRRQRAGRWALYI